MPVQANLGGKDQKFYWDSLLPGFGLKLSATKAVYVVQRRVKDERGNEKNVRHILGNYRSFSTPTEARKAAGDYLHSMKEGVDPNAEKQRAKSVVTALTVRRVFSDYFETKEHRLRPKTKQVYESAINRCFADWLELSLADISEAMIAARHKQLSNANGKRGKGEAQANQAMRVLRTLFNFAMISYKDAQNQPLLSSNPVKFLSQLDLWNENKRRTSIISDQQLKPWFDAVMKLDNATTRDYLLLCLFTGLRRTEAMKLKWERVQYEGDKPMLSIPKEDAKTNCEHNVPLSDFVVALFKQRGKIRRIDNNYVFPGDRPGSHLVEPKRAIEKVIKESGVEFSMHDLRRTFETIAARLDIPYYALKKLLNHSTKNDITGGYVVLDIEHLRVPMQKIADHIKQCARLTTESERSGVLQ